MALNGAGGKLDIDTSPEEAVREVRKMDAPMPAESREQAVSPFKHILSHQVRPPIPSPRPVHRQLRRQQYERGHQQHRP